MQILVSAALATLIAAVAVSAARTGSQAAVPPVSAGSTGSQAAVTPGSVSHAAAVTGGTAVTGSETAPEPLGTLTGRSPTEGAFGWPLSPRPAVRRRFEQPRDQWSPGHRGVDLLAAVGQPVLSAGDGVVVFSGVIASRGVITVRHPRGLRTSYEPVDERLSTGTLVRRGDRIGLVGSAAGHCVPLTCVHWGVISAQTYLDPLSLLGFGRPILLPLG